MKHVLTARVRRWAYGVTVAAVGLAVFAGWLPLEASPVVLPLVMALFYVDHAGAPLEGTDKETGSSPAAG